MGDKYNRRQVIQAGLASAAPAVLRGSFAQRKLSQPNILFLMADQYRGDCLGVSGNTAIRTPNLDRIAREGACFRGAYSSTRRNG